MSARRFSKCPKDARAYKQLWRVVDGAVADAFAMHPDYLTAKGLRSAQLSVTKRVTGAVIGFAEQSAKAALVANPAADKGVVLVRDIPSDTVGPCRTAPVLLSWGRLFTWWAA